MTSPRRPTTTLIPAARGQFVLKCTTPCCELNGTRWIYTPEQLTDGLVLIPNFRCIGCGCEPRTIEQPKWGA
jgi:hypothetical protein